MMTYLTGNDMFAVTTGVGRNSVSRTSDYTPEELASVGLPENLTKQDILNIVFVRYLVNTTSYRKYLPVTIATNLSDASVADLMEQ
jgi:penicillin-binding protein 2